MWCQSVAWGVRSMEQIYDVAVIGGGAAGLWALRGLKDKSVMIIEGNDRLGAKLLATGGGKCNFTNRFLAPEHFISSNPHFIKSFLHKLTTEDVLDFVVGHGIPYEERDNGKLFTLSGAASILEALLEEGKGERHHYELNCMVQNLEKVAAPDENSCSGLEGAADAVFCVQTTRGDFLARKVVVASGGLSYPRLGATNIAAKIARKFGMRVLPMVPALAGLRYPDEIAGQFSSLSGIAITAGLAVEKRRLQDQLLFTHRGFSGPLALNASLFVEGPTEITVDFAPGLDVARLIENSRGSRKSLAGLLSERLPRALVRVLLAGREYDLAQIRRGEVTAVSDTFNRSRLVISQVDGYDRAEVTRGGVSVDEIFPKTMESRTCPGLYFIGEALDVTGMLGGYNLHWAWASAQMLVEGLE